MSTSSSQLLRWICLIVALVISKNENFASQPSPAVISDDQLKSYRDDGYIVMSNLLSEDLVNKLEAAGRVIANRGQKFPSYFSVVERGAMFNGILSSADWDESDVDFNVTKAFRQAALYSKIPQIAAELMELDSQTQSLRVLR